MSRPLYLLLALAACERPATANHLPEPPPAQRPSEDRPLGVRDVGVFSDLDDQVRLALPQKGPYQVRTGKRATVLYAQGHPAKVYPARLRQADSEELRSFPHAPTTRAPGTRDDRDGDGIPNALDILIGAKKTVLNGAAYGAGYIKIAYPGGDVPRHQGVCTDVVIRAVRNAGLDLQKELHEDIRRAPKRYPMVKGRGNANIDHRRVKTLLPYFKKHWATHDKSVSSRNDPVRPGDIVFMDTFPSRPGPDHIGVVSDLRGESGHLLVINNWTDGSRTAELDLLSWVPVTHRFRMR